MLHAEGFHGRVGKSDDARFGRKRGKEEEEENEKEKKKKKTACDFPCVGGG
jgi:hypothetical protein